jgi:16S rRNA (guanine527-N7)-methyltransferase
VAGAGPGQPVPGHLGAAPAAPPSAQEVFGPALPLAARYAALLAGPGVERGILGPREAGRLWDRHLLNCAPLAELIPPRSLIVDVGSGGGLPGVILAMLLPNAKVVLLEPMARRAAFLEECVRELGLSNAATCRLRAEEAAGDLVADVVTARAVAPLDRLVALTLPLVRPGGLVLALKGASAEREVQQARPVLRKVGVREVAVVRAGVGRVSPPPVVVCLTAGARNESAVARQRAEGALLSVVNDDVSAREDSG